MPKLREPRRKPDLETNTAPDLISDDRRRDLPQTRPDTLDERARRGKTGEETGDEDQDDLLPEDFERDIDRTDAPVDEVVR